jgi:uncharacterized membrane-anchored protein
MRLTGLLSPTKQTQPGVIGVARVDRHGGPLLRRIGPGDIAVLDQPDLDRRTADALVAAAVVGVVNASASISGRYPNLGPEALLAAGVPLVDAVGHQVLRVVKDGAKIRLHGGAVYVGEREVARGVEQTAESIADQMIAAKAGMLAQLEAFSANMIEFLRRERALILDGVGVPTLRMRITGRQVLVVGPGHGHDGELKRLHRYLRQDRPVLIGVEAGADALCDAGLRPDVVVGDPGTMSARTLRSGAEVVLPAPPDGLDPGLTRVQDLGISAVTFSASCNSEDLALLLAQAHGASLVVTVGIPATLHEFLDRGRCGSNPSTYLTRLKLGDTLVSSGVIVDLHRGRVSVGVATLLLLAALAAMTAALVVTDTSHVYAERLVGFWLAAGSWFKGLLG